MSPCCDLDLDDSKQFFSHLTLWLIMLHHHTKLGNNVVWVQKITSGKTFMAILNLCFDLDLDRSNPFFAQDTSVYDVVLSHKVMLQTDQQLRRYSRNNHVLIT